MKLDLAQNITKCYCILHNFVRVGDGYLYDDILTVQGLENVKTTNVARGSQTVQICEGYVRQLFCNDD